MIATPHPENPGIVHFRAFERLNPGLYELAVSTGAQSRSARVGILWDSLNQREYSAANCVDRIVGTDAGYRSCTERGIGSAQLVSDSAPFSQVQPSLGGLAITLANPVRENNGLTIRGTVTNNSAIVQPVPALRATLIDQAGEPADSWTFVTSQSSIEPGAQIGFTTWRPALQGATRLDVDFVDANRRAG
jgi:hypothetical protein